jgi:polysaccharide export outer membrane protein
MAPPAVNVEEVDLSQLTSFSVSSQRIDCGDVLEVTIVTDFGSVKNTTTPVRVDRDGTGNVPLIGQVALAGLELDEAEQRIAADGIARGVFQRPHVTVTMKRQRMNRVTVIGAVEEPGVYELPRSASSLLAALVEAGGLSEEAAREVEIRRPVARAPWNLPGGAPLSGDGVHLAGHETPVAAPPPRITRVNLATAAAEGNGGHYLDDGDVVLVRKKVPKPFYVIGLVRNPGEFDLPPNQDIKVLDAVALAGDRSMQIADKVFVIRQVPDREQPVVIQTSIRAAKRDARSNVRLAPGDIVSVEETPATVVLDALKSFIRFGLSSALPIF